MLFEKIKLEENEQILLIVRRHWFVFFLRASGILVAAIAPFVLIVVARSFDVTAEIIALFPAGYTNQLWFFAALWLLSNWCAFAYIWTDHYLDVWVITDRRIISINQRSLFDRAIGSFRLERLQDLNIEIPGLFATLFHYGNIEAQTASGSENEFSVVGMPKPREIKSIILEAADRRMRSMSAERVQNIDQAGL